MAIEEGVECPGCRRAVVPRLLFINERNVVAYRKTQHICPYCGVIMYQTGGGVNWTNLIIIILAVAACGLIFLAAVISQRRP